MKTIYGHVKAAKEQDWLLLIGRRERERYRDRERERALSLNKILNNFHTVIPVIHPLHLETYYISYN
jgi:hypothetical protein